MYPFTITFLLDLAHIMLSCFITGAKVILACRNEKEGEITAGELKKKTKNENIRCMKCDLASFKSVEDFVQAFKKSE